MEEALRELDDEEESERILELFSAPVRSPLASMLERFFGMGRTPGESDGGAELPVGGHTSGPVGRNAKPAQAPPGLTLELAVDRRDRLRLLSSRRPRGIELRDRAPIRPVAVAVEVPLGIATTERYTRLTVRARR
jgi:hypothetical protein